MPKYTIDGKSYFFEDEIGQDKAEELIAKQKSGDSGESGTYEGFFTESFEGAVSGASNIVEGLVTLPTLGVDLIAGTNSTEAVEEWFDETKKNLGIDPEGLAGTVTEALVQFGIPGIGAASAASKVGRVARIASGKSKIGVKSVGFKDARQLGQKYGDAVKGRASALSRSQRAGLVAQEIAAAGLADAIVSTDGTQTLGDFFDGGPTETIDTVGLEGRDLAFSKILNKMKVGIEGGVATGIIPPILGASFKTINTVAATRPIEALGGTGFGSKTTILDIASGFTLPAAKKGIEVVGKKLTDAKGKILTETPDSLNSLEKIVGWGASMLTYGGFLDPVVARAKALVNPEMEGATKRATSRMKEIDKEIKRVLKTSAYRSLPDLEKRKIIDNFSDILDGTDPNKIDMPVKLKQLYVQAKRDIDNLSNRILKSAAVKELPEVAARSGQMTRGRFERELKKNISSGGYLRRLYRIFNDKDYVLKPDDKAGIIDKIKSGEGVSYPHIKGILTNTPYAIDEDQMASLIAGTSKLTQKQANEYVDRYLAINKERGGPSGAIDRIFKVRLDTTLISKRKVDSAVQKAILGEVKDPKEAYIATISELSNFIASDKMLDTFRQSADASIANTIAKNKLNVARGIKDADGNIVKEKQLFFKMDDEILKIIKEDPELFASGTARGVDANGDSIRLASADEVTAVSQLDEGLIKKAVSKWKTRNQGYEILGRTSQTAGDLASDPFSSSANSVYGTMFGYAIPKAMHVNMSSKVWADGDAFPTMLKYIYQPMMSLKGTSQYVKTILSPITQVRNVTSAAMFALAQGNFGKGSSLGTSVNIVLRDIIDKELKLGNTTFDQLKLDNKTLDFLSDLQERGVIGSSAQLREIQDNLRKGLGYDRQGQSNYGASTSEAGSKADFGSGDVAAARGNPEFAQTQRSKLGQFFKTPLNKFEDLYRGGDDIWKIYNYTFEMQKFRNARRKMQNAEIKKVKQGNLYKSFEGNNEAQLKLIGNATRLADENFGKHINNGEIVDPKLLEERFKQFAADNVRNLVPNYELVPEAITGLRGLPFGDFIAFPAEILRTGFNTLDVGMKELSSNSAAIREIGTRRLMGSLTAFGMLGSGIQEFGKHMTGTSQEEIDAINRLAAPYQRNAQFVPLGTDEKGNPEVMDFSHTNPYDMLSKPYHTLLRSLRTGAKLDKSGFENVRGAAFETVSQFFEPFFGVSMVYDAMLDVAPKSMAGREGSTQSGAKVYKATDTIGKQIEKSMIHMLDTLRPNMIPIRVPVGSDLGLSDFSFTPIKSPEVSRFIRGTFMEPGSVEPTTGRTYKAGGEIFRAFTGLNTQIIDREKVLGFKSQEFKSTRSSASTLFNDVLYLDNPSKETFIEGYKRADAARLKAFRELKIGVDDLKKLGLKEYEIRRVMKEKGVGRKEINSVLNDMYRSFRPNKEKRKEALRKGFDYPFSEIQDLIDARDFMSLTPVEPVEEPVEPKKDPLDLSSLNITIPQVQNNQRNVTPNVQPQPLAQSSLDQGITSSAGTRNVASFLGSNPTDIAKNMDIARRTG